MDFNVFISIGAMVIALLTFVFSRVDKAKKDAKEDNLELLNYKVDELKKDMSELLNKFDKYEMEIDQKVEKAIDLHIKLYHKKRGDKNDD